DRQGIGPALVAGPRDRRVAAGVGPLHPPGHVRAARHRQDDRRPGDRLGREGNAGDLRRPQETALITWGAPSGPPNPPALRAPAEPWRFASVQSDSTSLRIAFRQLVAEAVAAR